jgi:Phasin protein
MQAHNDPVSESYQHQMDASREVAGVVFDVVDQMEHLVLDSAHKAFDERMRFYQSLSAVRAPQDVLAFQAEFFSHTPERLLRAQQDWMHIFSESQRKISEAVQHYKVDVNRNGNLASRLVASDADDASQPIVALGNMFSMWDKAFKETVAMATGGMASASSASQNDDGVVDVVQKPVKRKNARAR